jgi:voltage-gated potassium channel
LFAATYYVTGQVEAGNFGATLTRIDALYFTVTVSATVGFGDIVARTEVSRLFVTLQMLADLVLIGLSRRCCWERPSDVAGISTRDTSPPGR